MHYSLQPSLKASSGARERPPQPDAAAVASLCKAADAIGTRMQYSHQGFLPNVRQQRAGGLAAIELAQTLRQLVCARGPTAVRISVHREIHAGPVKRAAAVGLCVI